MRRQGTIVLLLCLQMRHEITHFFLKFVNRYIPKIQGGNTIQVPIDQCNMKYDTININPPPNNYHVSIDMDNYILDIFIYIMDTSLTSYVDIN